MSRVWVSKYLCSLLLLLPLGTFYLAYAQVTPSQVLVEGRPVPSVVALVQIRHGRLLLPLLPIARELGDRVELDTVGETISVELSHSGEQRSLYLRMAEIRQNDRVLAQLNDTTGIGVAERAEELLLPIETLSLLLDISVEINPQENSISILRRVSRESRPQARELKGATGLAFSTVPYWAGTHYGHDFSLGGQVQLHDSILSGGLELTLDVNRNSLDIARGFISLQRPSGQLWTLGNYAFGQAYKFLPSRARGLSLEQPIGRHQLSVFGGVGLTRARTRAGRFVLPEFQPKILGVLLSNRTLLRGSSGLGYGFGLIHFSGPNRGGSLLVQQLNHSTSRNRLQIDSAFGAVRTGPESATQTGHSLAIDASDFFRVGAHSFSFRAAHFGRFSTPQVRTYKDQDILSAQWSGQLTSRLNVGAGFDHQVQGGQGARTASQTFNWSAAYHPGGNSIPQVSIVHTLTRQRLTELNRVQVRLSQAWHNWRSFFSLDHLSQPNRSADSVSFGTQIGLGQHGNLHLRQNLTAAGQRSGGMDWSLKPWHKVEVWFTGGVGYRYESSRTNAPTQFTVRTSVWLRLPNNQTLQFSLSEKAFRPEFRVTLGGYLFSGSAEPIAVQGSTPSDAPASQLKGRVYQDVDLDGLFDPKTDRPLAGIRLWLDRSTMVHTDVNGAYHFRSVSPGLHAVAVGQATLEDGLFPLDVSNYMLHLPAQAVVAFDFRFAQKGTVRGTIWYDNNANGVFDENEKPAANFRVRCSCGLETLTTTDGSFLITDLLPGRIHLYVDLHDSSLYYETESIYVKVVGAGGSTKTIDIPLQPRK